MCAIKSSLSFEQQIQVLTNIVIELQKTPSLLEKLDVLNALPQVQEYLKQPTPIRTFLAGLTPECDYVIKSIIVIGQAPLVFNIPPQLDDKFEKLRQLLLQLIELEQFYHDLGGIIGYHLTILNLIVNKALPSTNKFEYMRYIHPEGLNIDQNSSEVRWAIRAGIENLKQMSEIYPVGGAGDRLNLIDEKTGIALPAAKLAFLGRTLLEGLIRDLQAREYLYFKLYRSQLLTPIAMMTSEEKDNQRHILTICQECNWFGRPVDSFLFFKQPLVPVITVEGNWSLSAPLTLTLKPGGHGVIWKLAEDQGVFAKLLALGRRKGLVRQINNPIAGLDHNLLALIGTGCDQNKAFGFISCDRVLNTAEGVNVLIENPIRKDEVQYCLTNIEYTDFAQKGIDETPSHPGGQFSIYPTNTNILFIDIPTIQNTLSSCPIPGQLINMKSAVPYVDSNGHLSYVKGGRLESTMQNIADYLVDTFPRPLKQEEFKTKLRTFIIYNQRIKTISTTKKSYKQGESPLSTPEQAFYDLLLNSFYLLKEQCEFEMPELGSLEDYLEHGPNFIVLYHPALGPLYSIIKQKLRKSRLMKRSELQLEIAEVDIEHLHLDGSLLIESTNPLGHQNEQGLLKYGRESRCTLKNVAVENKGIDWEQPICFWKNQPPRVEALKILLHEGSEFFAQDVFFQGSHTFDVPPYHRLTVYQTGKQGKIQSRLETISTPSWYWDYSFGSGDAIQLKREEATS
jgi:UTP---glucose-1-phosphate uridylyltransferase